MLLKLLDCKGLTDHNTQDRWEVVQHPRLCARTSCPRTSFGKTAPRTPTSAVSSCFPPADRPWGLPLAAPGTFPRSAACGPRTPTGLKEETGSLQIAAEKSEPACDSWLPIGYSSRAQCLSMRDEAVGLPHCAQRSRKTFGPLLVQKRFPETVYCVKPPRAL